MSIKERIQKDRIAALKAGEKDRKSILDYILGEIQKAQKDGKPGNDPAESVIQAYIKSQKDLAREFGESRPDDARRIEFELSVLSEYMPKVLTDDEVRAEIQSLIDSGVTGRGPIMAALKKKHGVALDGRRASELAAEAEA